MTPEAFRLSLDATVPPGDLEPALTALWWDGKNDWERAHDLVAEEEGPDMAWVHAYLHRKEGDVGNAAYWYRRAGQPVASGSLGDEWARIAASLLTR